MRRKAGEPDHPDSDRPDPNRPEPGRGRPRDASVDRAVLSCAIDLLAEVGLHNFTIEAVAARAGVGRPTVYRRWRTREELVIAALVAAVRPLSEIDTGDVRADLKHMLTQLVHDLDSRIGPAVLGLHAAIGLDSPLAQPLRQAYLRPREETLNRMIQRGVRSGDIRADLPADTIRDLIFGPPIYHLLLTRQPMSRTELTTVFDVAWTAISNGSRRRARRPA